MAMKRVLQYVIVIGLQAVGSMLSLVAFIFVFWNLWALPFIAVGFIMWVLSNLRNDGELISISLQEPAGIKVL